MPKSAYFKTTPGIAKCINLGIGCGIIFLSWFTQPNEFQKEIVDSTWKEYGLFTLSIAGVLFTLLSLAVSLFLLDRVQSSVVRIIDGVLHFYAAACFLVFGLLVLQATIWIFLAIGDCCRNHYDEPNSTCKLPGFLDDMGRSMAEGTFDLQTAKLPEKFFVNPPGIPNIPDCANDINYSPWLCNICINQLVQPRFEWKGAAGALGVLNSIFYGIVGAVALKLIRETFRIC